MKKKSTLTCITIGVLIFLVVSCTKDNKHELGFLNEKSENLHSIKEKGIPKDIFELSEYDASVVATMFLSGNRTKSLLNDSYRTFKNIIPIYGTDGKPAIYVINYNEGFIWVSATKKLFPVLAVVENGNFENCDNLGMGIDIIKDAFIREYDLLTIETVSQKVKTAWRFYEKESIVDNRALIETKSSSSEYQKALDEVYSYAYSNGYEIYKLNELVNSEGVTSDIIPENILQFFYRQVVDDYTFGVEYTLNTAYVLKKHYMEDTLYGPYTVTKWDQIAPYNSALENSDYKLGCVTIAAAQLMRYYEKPNVYNIGGTDYYWQNMPNTTSNQSLSTVLADLRKKLKINAHGGGYIKDAVSLLNSYGYNVKAQDYSSSMDTFIKRGNISILYGSRLEGKKKIGHAWICDGIHKYRYFDDYKLFALDREAEPEYSYICLESICEEDFISNMQFYHMNWGWGGNLDGWFYNNNWNPSSGINYEYDQGMIVAKIK